MSHLNFASLRKLRPFSAERFPLHAVRLSFSDYESLMEACSIPKGAYNDPYKLYKDANEKKGKIQTAAVRESIEMMQKRYRKQEEKRRDRLHACKAITKPADLDQDKKSEHVNSLRLGEFFRYSIEPISSFPGDLSAS